MLKAFPYALLYVTEKEEILITAVAHLHREPEHIKVNHVKSANTYKAPAERQ